MKENLYGDLEFRIKTADENSCHPLSGIFELTYACDFDCMHCYCKGSENPKEEMSLSLIKHILSELESSGCIRLALSGGDPLRRRDFPEIYEFAKKKGFLVDIFTNGYNLSDKIIDLFKKYPPLTIEITFNGISEQTFESVTRREGSFGAVLKSINRLKDNALPVVLKSNCLSLNKHEIIAIKSFSEELFGAGSRRFRLDPLVLPRLNGDKAPCVSRLSPEEVKEIFESDEDTIQEYYDSLACGSSLGRDREYLYQCSSWRRQFFINPFGNIKFCQFSDRFSVDLKKHSLSDYFSQIGAKILNEKFKTKSRCKDCQLRQLCYYCPARAGLETGSREGPVEYFCQLARLREQDSKKVNACLKT